MSMKILEGIMLPLWGTSLGAACVFFMRGEMNRCWQKILNGFAAGVMAAASVWSLLIPAMEQVAGMGAWSFVPAVTGFWMGIAFLLIVDRVILYLNGNKTQETKRRLPETAMLILAVALHNLPEGMAVGVAFAGFITGSAGISLASAMVLSLGIAIQNLPEGAIISLPLKAEGAKKGKAFLYGVLSGAVEPVGAIFTIWAAEYVVPFLPYLLSFSAGAMIYVVVEELIPQMKEKEYAKLGTIMFAVGFSLMMMLDVAFG